MISPPRQIVGGRAPAFDMVSIRLLPSQCISSSTTYCASDFPFEQCLVKQLHQLSRAAAARRQNAQQAGNQGSVQSGSGTLSADIAESNQRVLLSMLEEIVKIAADFAGRTGFQAYLESPDVRRDSRSQNILKFARRL